MAWQGPLLPYDGHRPAIKGMIRGVPGSHYRTSYEDTADIDNPPYSLQYLDWLFPIQDITVLHSMIAEYKSN